MSPRTPGVTSSVSESLRQTAPTAAITRSAYARQTGARVGSQIAGGTADAILLSPVLAGSGWIGRHPWELGVSAVIELQYVDLRDHDAAERTIPCPYMRTRRPRARCTPDTRARRRLPKSPCGQGGWFHSPPGASMRLPGARLDVPPCRDAQGLREHQHARSSFISIFVSKALGFQGARPRNARHRLLLARGMQ